MVYHSARSSAECRADHCSESQAITLLKERKHIGRRGRRGRGSKPALSIDAKNGPLPREIVIKKGGVSESDLRQRAIDILTSRGRRIDESTIAILVDRLLARKEEGLRKKKGGIRLNFTEADVEREVERAWIERLLNEPDAAEVRREAAYQEQCEEEECRDLVAKFARESAKKTGDAIGDVRDRYETIVIEFLAARYVQPDGNRYSLASVLHSDYETNEKLKNLLAELGALIEGYASRCIRGEPQYHWKLNGSEEVRAVEKLRGHAVSKDMMTLLALEYVRDRNGLISFLKAIFKHWREIYAPGSPWSVRLFTQQVRGRSKSIAEAIQDAGIVTKSTTGKQFDSLRKRIRKYRSRDQRAALPKKILLRLRSVQKRGMTESEIFQLHYFSSDTVPTALDALRRSGQANWKWKRTKTKDGKIIKARLWYAVRKKL